jgi:hypothetical protein
VAVQEPAVAEGGGAEAAPPAAEHAPASEEVREAFG